MALKFWEYLDETTYTTWKADQFRKQAESVAFPRLVKSLLQTRQPPELPPPEPPVSLPAFGPEQQEVSTPFPPAAPGPSPAEWKAPELEMPFGPPAGAIPTTGLERAVPLPRQEPIWETGYKGLRGWQEERAAEASRAILGFPGTPESLLEAVGTFPGVGAMGFGAAGIKQVGKEGAKRVKEANQFRQAAEEMAAKAGIKVPAAAEAIPPSGVVPPVAEAAAIPPTDPVKVLVDWLKGPAKITRQQADELLRQFRGRQITAAEDVRAGIDTAGAANYVQASKDFMSAMKGKVGRPEFKPPELTPEGIQELHKRIHLASLDDVWDRPVAISGLYKLLELGLIPEASEMTKLRQIFGPELVEAVMALKKANLWDIAATALNLPKAIKSSWDFSWPLRQNILAVFSHPFKVAETLPPSFKAAFSEKFAAERYAEMVATPEGKWLERAGVLTDWRGPLAGMEEPFQTYIANKIPGVSYSQRGFTMGTNEIRMALMQQRMPLAIADAEKAGKAVAAEDYLDMARGIGILTGRGDLGALNRAAPVINAGLFSVRLMASRLETPLLLAGEKTLGMSKPVATQLRKETARGLTSLLLTNFGIGMMGKELGWWEFEVDPRSTDFGRARVGNVHLDMTGGYLPYVRYLVQGLTSSRKTAAGKIVPKDRADVITTFARTKLSPSFGVAANILSGETFIGEKPLEVPRGIGEKIVEATGWPKEIAGPALGVGRQLADLLAPLTPGDVADAVITEGTLAGATILPLSVFGATTLTYEEMPSTTAQKLRDSIAKEMTGKAWDDLTFDQQGQLREISPEIAEAELQVERERIGRRPEEIQMKEAAEIEKRILSGLPASARTEMMRLAVGPTVPGRKITREGQPYYLNDERYERAWKEGSQLIGAALPKIIMSSSYKQGDDKIKTKALEMAQRLAYGYVSDQIVANKPGDITDIARKLNLAVQVKTIGQLIPRYTFTERLGLSKEEEEEIADYESKIRAVASDMKARQPRLIDTQERAIAQVRKTIASEEEQRFFSLAVRALKNSALKSKEMRDLEAKYYEALKPFYGSELLAD